ncbi:hypothetical protein [Cohnella yongneupensis]|uniref:Uncharacterized protein n=1 Tax=Cohnella yongneupensis TaxID=425006 RepID=A0ABW0R044_9BACL
MTLIEFYKNLIVEAFQKFEPVWQEDLKYGLGFRWIKRNYPQKEQFQITDLMSEPPVLMYSIVLPEPYLHTTIYEEIKNYKSQYELTLAILDRKLWLNATISTANLQDSIMGFINQARSQLMNIVDCTIALQDDIQSSAIGESIH